MKKTIGSVAVLAVVVLGGYYGTGLITERTLKKNIQMINYSNNVSVNLVAYQRGWFHSKANLVWNIRMPERFVSTQQGDSALVPSQTYSFETPVLIYHGPVSLEKMGVHFGLGYATTEVQIPEAYKKQFDEVFAPESIIPVVHASMFVSYFNQTHLHIQVPPFRLITIKNKDVIEWGGLESDFAVSAKKYHIDGHLTLNGANVSSGNMNLTLGKVSSEYDMQNKEGLYLGDASIAFPSLVLMKDKVVDFELADVDTKSESEVNDGLFQSSFHGSFEKLTRHGKSYGPGRITVELENLDAKVLANINDQASKMQRIPDSQRQQALLMMLPQLSTLLGKGATFEIAEFNIGMPDGVFDASLRVALPKGELGNPFQLIQKVEGKGKVKIPAQLLKTLLTRSVTESLLLQAEKEKLDNKAPDATVTEVSVTATPATTSSAVVPAEPVAQEEAKKSSIAPDDVKALDLASSPEFKQKVIVSVDKKIADLVNAGAIRLEGENYCLDLNLTAGQLSVNGHPFSPVMLQF